MRVLSRLSRLLIGLAACSGCDHATHDSNALRTPPRPDGPVVLGTPWLTSGIPGRGPLKRTVIEAWLDDERNHEPLDVVLPQWLAAAADQLRIPQDDPLTIAKIELGRQLFFDKRLSGIGTFSCATCHQPQQHFSSYQVMPEVERNVSTVFNRILGSEHFWDGRAASLETQPESPIKNPFEMNSSPEQTTAAVAAIDGYRMEFEAVFGEVSFANISRALAAFERAIVTGPSPWDYQRLLRRHHNEAADALPGAAAQLEEIEQLARQYPMSEAALRGEKLFFSTRAGCGDCHTGSNLTDERYHNLGVGMDSPIPDAGRQKVTGDPADFGAFKTPSLRNVAQTPPYMHNGAFGYLEEVVDFLDGGGHPNENLSPAVRPLHLTPDEKADLIAFLHALTSERPVVETQRLPE